MYPDSCTPYAPSWVGQAGEPLASWQSDEFDLNFYFISALTVTSLLHRILTCYNEAKQSLKLPATPSCLQEVKETVPADVDSIHTVFKLRYWFIFLVSRVSISLNQQWLKKICPTVYLLSSMWMSERQQKVGELYFSTCVLLTDEYRVNSLYVTFLSIQFRSDLVAAELEKIKRFNCILKRWRRRHWAALNIKEIRLSFNILCSVLLENNHLLRTEKRRAEPEGSHAEEAAHEAVSEDCIAEALRRTSKAIQDIDALISATTPTWKSHQRTGSTSCI